MTVAEFKSVLYKSPSMKFVLSATESGTFRFEWIGDNGFSASETVAITVE